MLRKWVLFIACILTFGSVTGQKVEVTALGAPDAVVYDLEFSKDGSKLATIEGNQVKVWSTAQHNLIQTLSGHKAPVLTLTYANDDVLATGSKDGEVIVWNTITGLPQLKITAHKGPVNAVAASPNGNLIATAGADHKVKVWNIETGLEEATFSGHTADVTAITFSKSGNYLISGSGDKLLKVWSLQDKKLYKTLKGHKDWVRSIAVHPKGEKIASAGDDKRILIWELSDPEATSPIAEFKNLHKNWITSVNYQNEGAYFVSTAHDNNLTISRTDSPESTYYVKYSNPVMPSAGYKYAWKATFQPNSYRIAIATLGKGVMLTDYFQKIYYIPHDLLLTEIGKQRFSERKFEYSVHISRVTIKGEVSRPDMISRLELLHGNEVIEIGFKRNGKFNITVDLATNGNDLSFVIIDKDPQINRSVHSVKIHYPN